MHSGPLRSLVVGFTILTSLAVCAADARAQQAPAIEIALPNQLVRGQSNVVHIAIPSRETFAGAEVSPPAGVTVTAVANNKKPELSQNVAWWDVTINVARDAAPGPRTLVLLTSTGRSTPATVVIPAHVPAISDLRVVQGTASAI